MIVVLKDIHKFLHPVVKYSHVNESQCEAQSLQPKRLMKSSAFIMSQPRPRVATIAAEAADCHGKFSGEFRHGKFSGEFRHGKFSGEVRHGWRGPPQKVLW